MAADNNQAQNPNFDFIMKQEPKPKRSIGLPSGLPKPLFLGIMAAVVLLIIMIVGSLLSGGSNLANIYPVLSDANVISGVAADTDTNITGADAVNLATTVGSSTSSQEQQIKAYLLAKKIKLNVKQIAAKPSSAQSAQLQAAKLNNSYDAALVAYFKTSLTSYQADIQKAYKDASPGLKSILLNAYNSNKTLLDSKQLQ